MYKCDIIILTQEHCQMNIKLILTGVACILAAIFFWPTDKTDGQSIKKLPQSSMTTDGKIHFDGLHVSPSISE